ncbi:hypothetical protein K457DRAFT_683797 [Linnemannia elongata AG-77]|uniref:Secreted protein n=1 Tax=Linnemannia elongata AG-77 TaxID=1314771 RepID=A0A197JNP1_9FUNG|nr:hypothetical protein K457DRAFT_683797 [Linnemannia elongata AG-77]
MTFAFLCSGDSLLCLCTTTTCVSVSHYPFPRLPKPFSRAHTFVHAHIHTYTYTCVLISAESTRCRNPYFPRPMHTKPAHRSFIRCESVYILFLFFRSRFLLILDFLPLTLTLSPCLLNFLLYPSNG